MKKNKIVAVLLAAALAISMLPTTVFAQETQIAVPAQEVTTIMPLDTIVPIQLSTTVRNNLYTGSLGVYEYLALEVTNNIINPGNIVFQVVNQNGNALTSPQVVAPGNSGNASILGGATAGSYTVQVWAQNVAGQYSLAINQGDLDSLISVQLADGLITNLVNFPFLPAGSKITITNTVYSPGPILIQVVSSNGTVLYPTSDDLLTRQSPTDIFGTLPGNSSVEVDVAFSGGVTVRGSVPSGTSTGIYEVDVTVD